MRTLRCISNVLILVFLVSATTSVAADEKQMSLRVATAQIPVTEDITENSAAIQRALDVAIRDKADVLLTPEGSLSGYTPTFDQSEVEAQLATIVKRASSAGLALAACTAITLMVLPKVALPFAHIWIPALVLWSLLALTTVLA